MSLDPCPHCEGSGEIVFNRTFPRDPQCDQYARCPFCGGCGAMSSSLEDAAWSELEKRPVDLIMDVVNDRKAA